MKKTKQYIMGLVILVGIGIVVYRFTHTDATSTSKYSISINKEQQQTAKKLAQKKELTEAELVAQYIGKKTEATNSQPITDNIVNALKGLNSNDMMTIADENFLGNDEGLSDILVMMSQNARIDTTYIKTLKNSDGTINIAIPYLKADKIAGLALVRYMPSANAYSMLTVVTPKQLKDLESQ